jgi:hypothetical protein
MSPGHGPDHVDLISLCALAALPTTEVAIAEAQIAACAECQHELETIRPVVSAFVSWPIELSAHRTRCGSGWPSASPRRRAGTRWAAVLATGPAEPD